MAAGADVDPSIARLASSCAIMDDFDFWDGMGWDWITPYSVWIYGFSFLLSCPSILSTEYGIGEQREDPNASHCSQSTDLYPSRGKKGKGKNQITPKLNSANPTGSSAVGHWESMIDEPSMDHYFL